MLPQNFGFKFSLGVVLLEKYFLSNYFGSRVRRRNSTMLTWFCTIICVYSSFHKLFTSKFCIMFKFCETDYLFFNDFISPSPFGGETTSPSVTFVLLLIFFAQNELYYRCTLYLFHLRFLFPFQSFLDHAKFAKLKLGKMIWNVIFSFFISVFFIVVGM